MSVDEPSPDVSKCPTCRGQMIYVRTVWRGFELPVDVWFCTSCNKIVRQPSMETKH